MELIYFVFIHISLLIIGLGFVLPIQKFLKRNESSLTLTYCYAASIVILALISLARYVLNIDPKILSALFWLILFGAFVSFVKLKAWTILNKSIYPLSIFVLASLISLLVISLSFNKPFTVIPDPEPLAGRNYQVFDVKVLNVAHTNANDNSVPYRQAQFIINRSDPAKDSFIDEWGVHFFQRTPLMGFVTAGYFLSLNDKPPIDYIWSSNSNDINSTFTKFQIIAHILNFLFIVPAYALIEKIFSKKTASVTIVFFAVSQFFIYNSFFSWPKSLVAFFILGSWYLIMERNNRSLLVASVFAGLAYLAHDLAVLYIGASLVYLLLERRAKHAVLYSVYAACFAIPWILVSSLIYNKPSTFILYPLSTDGIPQVNLRKEIIQNFLHTSPIKLLTIRLESLFYLLSPYQLIYSEGGQQLTRRIWAFGLYSIPGALGIGLILPAVISLLNKFSLKLASLIFMPIILSVVVIGWPKGLGALHFAQASIVLLSACGISILLKSKHSKVLIRIAYLATLFHLIYFIGFSYGWEFSSWLNNYRDVAIILSILGTIATLFVMLNRQLNLTTKNRLRILTKA